MEDAYSVVQDLKVHPTIKVSYFAVFDGHGGSFCANFVKDKLQQDLAQAFAG